MKKSVAIYARVSTDEQANNFSLDSQVNYCREYIGKKGYELAVDPFREDFTGTVLDRPELDKIRELALAGQIDRLVALELDRLGRGLAIPFVLESEFKKLGVTVEYVQEQYDDTPEGALKKGMRATISEYERLKTLERTKRGRAQKAKSGSVTASSVKKYGYEAVKNGRQTDYCPVPDEMAVVLSIYQWFVLGDETGRKLQPAQIARRLSELRIPTRMDKLGGNYLKAKRQDYGVWHKKTVSAILHDETYAGTAYAGLTKRVNVNGKNKLVPQPRDTWIPIPVKPIVPRDLWEAAQRKIADNRCNPAANSRNNTRSVYLMRGRLICAKCGYVLTYNCRHLNATHQMGYYRCAGARLNDAPNHERTCSGTYRQADIDAQIWEQFAERLKNPEYILEAYRRDRQDTEQQNGPIRQRLDIITRRLDELTAERANLLEQHLKSLFPVELLDRRATELNASIQSFEAEKADLEARIKPVRIDENSLAGLLEYSTQVREGLDHLTPEQKRLAVELFDLRGLVTREGNNYTIELSGIIPETLIVIGQIKDTSAARGRRQR